VPSERVGAALAPACSRHRDPSRLDPRLGAASVYFLHRRRQKNDFVGDHCDRRSFACAFCYKLAPLQPRLRAEGALFAVRPIVDVRIVDVVRAVGDRSRTLLSFLSILFAVLLSGLFRYPSIMLAHVAARLSRNGGKSQGNIASGLSEFQQYAVAFDRVSRIFLLLVGELFTRRARSE